MRIALDAMGGDNAPAINVDGAIEALKDSPDSSIFLVGDEQAIGRALERKNYPASRLTIVHASESIAMDESPSNAIRRKKDSSMRRAVEMVKAGNADAVVTAGNSGAAMALAMYIYGVSEGVERPAIATTMPSFKEPFLLLDAGANVDCSAENLRHFALMGDAYARLVMDRPTPRIALLSIGEEPTKGNEVTKEAHKLLMNTNVNFVGNVEGKEIYNGDVDVVVCDGFVGNIFLKTSEGIAELFLKLMRKEISESTLGKIGYLLIKPALSSMKKKIDYNEYGGAPLLGLNGSCIISHGRSDAKAIKNAIRIASEFAGKRVHEAVRRELCESAVGEKTVA